MKHHIKTPCTNCGQIEQGSIIRLNENGQCLVCGRQITPFENMWESDPFDHDEYHRQRVWPYYLALIAFAIAMALVVSDYVWGAEDVTNTIINSIFKE